jgi:hypothetical protein
MSGQPYRYVKDIENFRNEYMDALNLRANIDNMNFQANKIYKETGALPPKSTMKDMRTTAEVLMDVEKLKQNIIAEFAGLATPQMIQLVLQRVQSSRLNGDGSFLVWLAQNVKELVPQLKKKYAYGIAGDSNDAENMYLFIADIFSKTKDINTTLKSAFDRPVGSDNIGINVGDFAKLKKAYDDIQFRLISSPVVSGLRNSIRDKFNAMDLFIAAPTPPIAGAAPVPGATKYEQLKNIFINVSNQALPGQQNQINQTGYKALIEYTDKLPSPSQVRTILDQLIRSESNADPSLTIKLLENLSSILPEESASTNMSRLADQIINSRGVPVNQPLAPPAAAPPHIAGNPRPMGAPALMAQATPLMDQVINYVRNQLAGVCTAVTPQTPGNPVPDPALDQYFTNQVIPGIINAMNAAHGPGWQQVTSFNAPVLLLAIQQLTNNFDWNFTNNGGAGLPVNIQAVRAAIDAARGGNAQQVMIGAGIGRRVGRPRGSGIVKPLSERIDNTKGIKQGHTHVPFGKYIINKNRLDDDIFSFKHVKGYGVKGYPSKKISRNLSNVIKTIIGGGVPKFNELSNLSEDEKNYLHTVTSKAGIMDKLSVPTPSKDTMEQDIHQFEVMKGEILAGNDSTVLIKKFKLLLLKLSKNGTLPKRESQEIMEDLIQLGY